MKNLIKQVLKEYVHNKYKLLEQRAETKPNKSNLFKGALFANATKGLKDTVVSGSYTAAGKSSAYDALHSFHMRASDRFGGRINTKVQDAIKEYKKTTGIDAVDIKKMVVNIEPNSLTVNWKVYIGPSGDGYTYEYFDSRGSANGGVSAVDKQLPSMHSVHSGTPKLVYHYNQNIPVCFKSNGTKKPEGCKGTINIQQKFFKYGKKV